MNTRPLMTMQVKVARVLDVGAVPYGMRPGWVTGTHMPSPQAQKDHFREY